MTVIYDADLKGYIELIADDSSLFQRFTIKLSEDEYYRLLESDEDELLSEIARIIGEQKTASYYYDGKVVFEWLIEGKKYSKVFSPYDGERVRDYTIINA